MERTVKIDIFKFARLSADARRRPSGRRRVCGVQAFSPQAKTLAQAEFTA
jgi:hypothetical protein